jgi:hypothetical protein
MMAILGNIIETVLNAKGVEKTSLEVLKRTKDAATNEGLFKTLLQYVEGVRDLDLVRDQKLTIGT